MPPPPPPGKRPMYGGGPQGYGPPNSNIPTGPSSRPPLGIPPERYTMSISQTMVPLPNSGQPQPPPGHVRMPPPHAPFGGPAVPRSMIPPPPPGVGSIKRPAMQGPMQANQAKMMNSMGSLSGLHSNLHGSGMGNMSSHHPTVSSQLNSSGFSTPSAKKKKKLADKILPQKVRDLVPESQAYMDLLAFERKLDFTITRKRLDIQEALKRPMKQKRKLRIFISNTFFPGKH